MPPIVRGDFLRVRTERAVRRCNDGRMSCPRQTEGQKGECPRLSRAEYRELSDLRFPCILLYRLSGGGRLAPRPRISEARNLNTKPGAINRYRRHSRRGSEHNRCSHSKPERCIQRGAR